MSKVFHVLTEFRFDVGHAVANSELLKSKVDSLSSAADGALFSFSKMSAGIVAQMGLGSGGITGAIYQAIQASDKFRASQLAFSNVMLANTNGAMSFEQSMANSADLMDRIGKTASKFALPGMALMKTTQTIGAAMLNEGLDDTSHKNSLNLSRMFLKSAPVLGIDPGLAQGQLLDTVTGRANGGDTLFQRLTNETKAMKPYAGKTGAFNALEPAKRLNILTKALSQFSSQTGVVAGNAMLLSNIMQSLGEKIKGPFSILRPIGDVLMKHIVPALDALNNWLGTHGRQLAETFANIIDKTLKSPQKLIVTLLQLRKASEDLLQAGGIMGLAGIIMGLGSALAWLTGKAAFASALIGPFTMFFAALGHGIAEAFPMLGPFIKGLGMLATAGALAWKFPIILTALGWAFKVVLLPLTQLFLLMQLFSRAAGYAKLSDAKALADNAVWYAEVGRKFMFFFNMLKDSIMYVFDGIARFISPVFQVTGFLGMALSILESFLDGVAVIVASMQGIFNALLQVFINFANDAAKMVGLGKNKFGQSASISEAFKFGFDDFMDQYLNAMKSGDAVANMNVNIDKIEMNNNFKENMEPDRVAFSIKDQLLKAASNPTQGRGRSMTPGSTGGW